MAYSADRIAWRVEWVFPEARARLHADRISELTPLTELVHTVIGKRADNVALRTRLSSYFHTMTGEPLPFILLMKAEERAAADVRYHELRLDQSLRQVLAHTVIIEYPVIYVVTAVSAHEYARLPVMATENRAEHCPLPLDSSSEEDGELFGDDASTVSHVLATAAASDQATMATGDTEDDY